MDDTDEKVTHVLDINVHKLNATTPGVCNWVNDDGLVEMGKEINKYIKEHMNTTPSRLLHKLQKMIPDIDSVYKEETEFDAKGRVKESDEFEVGFKDIDLSRYVNNKSMGYQIRQWKKGDVYSNKYYTSFIDEEYDTNSNPFNNSVILLGSDGLKDLDVMEKSRPSLRKDRNLKTNKRRFFLSDILIELDSKKYTDVVIIDLSCSTGFGDTAARQLHRENNKKRFLYGGKT